MKHRQVDYKQNANIDVQLFNQNSNSDKNENDNLLNLKTKFSVNKTHQINLSNNKNNFKNTGKIVEILGGIDKILTNYLNPDLNIKLTETQLIHISEIISEYNYNSEDKLFIKPSITLNKNNNLLHDIFNVENSLKIINLIFSKKTGIFLGILNVLWSIWAYANPSNIFYYVYTICVCFISIFILIFWLLSLNKKLFQKLLLKSFIFWFKILSSIEISLLYLYLKYILRASYFSANKSMIIFDLIIDILVVTLIILLILIFSSIDGLQIKAKSKIIFGFLISSSLTIHAIAATLTAEFEDNNIDTSIIFMNRYIKFSVLSLYSGAARSLTLFLWKQTISSVKKYKNDTAIAIKTSVRITWIDAETDSETIHNVITSININKQNKKIDSHHINIDDNNDNENENNIHDQYDFENDDNNELLMNIANDLMQDSSISEKP